MFGQAHFRTGGEGALNWLHGSFVIVHTLSSKAFKSLKTVAAVQSPSILLECIPLFPGERFFF